MVIMELINTGLLAMFFYCSEPLVWIPGYFCLFLGMLVQFILWKKSRKKLVRMLIFELGFIGALVCECILYLSVGWQRLMVTMGFLLLLSMLLGALIAVIGIFLKDMNNLHFSNYQA